MNEPIVIDEETRRELESICRATGMSEAEAAHKAIDFFWGACKDTLCDFVGCVRTVGP